MNKRIETLIPAAFLAVKEEGIDLVKDGGISRLYNGYIAAFGASVIQSGMLPALVFNHRKAETSGSEEDPSKLMDAIFYVIKQAEGGVEDVSLLEYYRKRPANAKKLKGQILDAAAAIKLVIRTFELTDPKKDEPKPSRS